MANWPTYEVALHLRHHPAAAVSRGISERPPAAVAVRMGHAMRPKKAASAGFTSTPTSTSVPGDPVVLDRAGGRTGISCVPSATRPNVVLNYDVGHRPVTTTTWFEINVGCEACHGPGSDARGHAVEAGHGVSGGLVVDLDDRDGAAWRMNLPTRALRSAARLAMQPPQQPEACGRCHARRGVISD